MAESMTDNTAEANEKIENIVNGSSCKGKKAFGKKSLEKYDFANLREINLTELDYRKLRIPDQEATSSSRNKNELQDSDSSEIPCEKAKNLTNVTDKYQR